MRQASLSSSSLPSSPFIFKRIRSVSQFSSVQSLSHVWLFATPWITARRASLSITNSQSSLKLVSIELVMPSSRLNGHEFEWLWVKVTQLRPTLCDPKDYTIRGILQAGIMEWVAVPFSKGSSQPRDWTQVFHIAGGFFTSWATRKALNTINQILNLATILHHLKNAHLPIFLEISNT